jgi:glycosyltransferase involved in cell wall biosynthesis
MYGIYKSASIVCLPSYREGLPKVLLEAASVGRPLVAFDVPGCREIVRSGSTGELVPFGREDLLEQTLMSLIDDKEKCEQLGINGHHLVCSEFASEVINEQTSQIWQGLLGD